MPAQPALKLRCLLALTGSILQISLQKCLLLRECCNLVFLPMQAHPSHDAAHPQTRQAAPASVKNYLLLRQTWVVQ